MKKIISALLLFCFSYTHSQITFEKGYFINNNDKKTECYIENLDWKSNPTSFVYKLQLSDSEAKTENIIGVKEFAIDNEDLFKRYTVNLERSQNTSLNPNRNKDPQWKQETIFLRTIVSGNANLYVYVDGNIEKFFYETKTNPVEQLLMISYRLDNLNVENSLFRQQLFNNVKCENMPASTFEALKYTKKSLANHFAAYNKCSGGNENGSKNTNYTAYEKKREVFNLRFTPGAYIATVAINDPDDYYDVSTHINQLIAKIAFDAEFVLPFNNNAWSMFINPTYSKFNPSKNYVTYVNNPGFPNDGDAIHYSAKTSYSQIEIPIGFRRYFYINSASKIFINAAYVIVANLSDSEIVVTNSENLTNANVVLPIGNKNNFAVGAGYSYNRFSLEVRYNTARDLTNYPSWKAKYTSLGINLGYKIF